MHPKNPAPHLDVGRIVTERRKELGITQEELADLTGLSTRAIGQLELGQTSPRLTSLHTVLDALGLELTISTRRPTKSTT